MAEKDKNDITSDGSESGVDYQPTAKGDTEKGSLASLINKGGAEGVGQHNKKKVYIVVCVAIALLLIYFAMSVKSDNYVVVKNDAKNAQPPQDDFASQPQQAEQVLKRQLPSLPEIEKIDFPEAPPPPQVGMQDGKIEDVRYDESRVPKVVNDLNSMSSEEKMAKMSANIVVFSGGSGGEGNANASSSFLGFAEGGIKNSKLRESSSPSVPVSSIKNLDKIILQGKVINGVLETAIDTELAGSLRAVIVRDVYAEQGNNVLIPKGSRIIGSYSSGVSNGKKRIAVMWERIITPSGLDINVMSPSTDQLGRTGLPGVYHDKFLAKLGNAFLVSYIVPLITTKLSSASEQDKNKITISDVISPANQNITSTKSGDLEQLVMYDAAKKFVDLSSKAISDKFDVTPNITVDQGTKINILVAKDLRFY